MIRPQQNKLIHWAFHHYVMKLVKRSYHNITYNKLEVPVDKAVLMLANHYSWWDGFLLYHVNHYLLKKRFHVMVIEETVKKVSFFKYMGAFSVQKNSRDVVESLNYAAELLNDPQNLVLIFPQGKLYSNFADEIRFEKGLARIIDKVTAPYQVIMAATFTENLQHKKPSANVYLANLLDKPQLLTGLQQQYQQHYNSARAQQTQKTV